MSKIFFNSKRLCAVLKYYNQIVIYGAGNYAKEIYPKLVEWGLREKIVSFTQTEETDIDVIDGIPVIPINTLQYDKKEGVVLVAVSQGHTEEVRNNLNRLSYQNIEYLTDYQISYEQYCTQKEEDFNNSDSFEDYCKLIADWYVDTQVDHLEKRTIMQELLDRGQCADLKRDSNLVVMICGYLTSRTVKLIGALESRDYNIVLLNCCVKENTWNMSELRKTKVVMHYCQRIEELLYVALQYLPLVYFFEPQWGDCRWAQIMFKEKEYFGKVVLALYDVMNDGYVGIEEDKLTAEKRTLECADGIVWRWFSKEYLEKRGFHFGGKSIQFIDYCSHTDIKCTPDDEDSSIVKICFMTGKGNPFFENRTHFMNYPDWALVDEILNRIGNRGDCLFHFYAGILSDNNIEQCEQYKKQYKNFDFFVSIEHDELLNRLKKYDYGCELLVSEKLPPNDMSRGKYYGSVLRNSIRNAYFDFLSAELPIITTVSSKLWEYLSEYNVVIPMCLDSIDIDYLKQNKKYYKQNAKRARQELDINNQIIRLIQFFKEV